ncbi:MAG: hypothetical protein PHS23_09850 [Candidatus Cloacimonetes bacterium]|jgi:hypothetical protein|nr:hypothetical protein [Candidatus Cloacimonadota bacterium]MDD3579280.1 hypothetical protein [Candidatus Cloacimonadota bacterium]
MNEQFKLKWQTVVSFLLTFACIFLTIEVRQEHAKLLKINELYNISLTESQSINNSLKTIEYKDGLYRRLWLSNISWDELKSTDFEVVKWNDIVQGSKFVIWYDHVKVCADCLERILQTFIDSEINPGDIIIVSNYNNVRDLKSIKAQYGLEYDCYLANELPNLQLEGKRMALFFSDKNRSIYFPCIVDSFDGDELRYLSFIQSKFVEIAQLLRSIEMV